MSAQPVHLDESPVIECQEVQKSPDFWFGEGRFVLIASQKVAYRVHGDVLGRKSKVFNDLLNLQEVPRPDSEDTMDGCPIVHITDSPEDFKTFLSIIYDGFEQQRLHARKPRWATVRVMILLGDKYDVSEIHEEGLCQLRIWYADDIEVWDKRDKAFFAHETDHLSVASVTRTLGNLDLHAAVLYHCCRLSVFQLVFGDLDTSCPSLCADDLARTLQAVKDILKLWNRLSFPGVGNLKLFHDLLRCPSCRDRYSAIQLALQHFFQTRMDTDAFKLCDPDMWLPLTRQVANVLCEKCVLDHKECVRSWRQKFRISLREFFEYT